MRNDWSHIEKFRVRKEVGALPATETGDLYGMFVIGVGEKRQIRMLAVDGEETGWEHVSVSVKYKNARGQAIDVMPTWDDMCRVKALFWEPEECVVQYHPPESRYMNHCNNVLHLWKYVRQEFPQPPLICV
jgi:hypothetical protein